MLMFGLVVLFLLGLWLVVIVFSVWLPYRLLRGRGQGIAIAGALLGFTLSFAGWVVKWRIEHWLVQRDLTEACKQAGVFVYVEPEQWKQMVGGEEAWRKLGHTTSSEKDSVYPQLYPSELVFRGVSYTPTNQVNDRIVEYYSGENKYGNYGVYKVYLLYYDINTKRVLYQHISAHSKYVDLGFKWIFWTNLKGCGYDRKSLEIYDEFVF